MCPSLASSCDIAAAMCSAQGFADQLRTCDSFFRGCQHLDAAVQAKHASSIVVSLGAQLRQMTGLSPTEAPLIIASINEASFLSAVDKSSMSAVVSELVQGTFHNFISSYDELVCIFVF